MMLHDIGVVGMAVMGSNLALNMADHQATSLYTTTRRILRKILERTAHDKIHGFELDE